ncbi:hypothetical protein [Uliginosibacterium sediminicola]|uniref:PsiF repeat-containing protein n=1 Tax=Uliginosibacterium sediminicola TaxID=2024550 RepID=A0ABU9Z3U3_9RHOO
MRATKLLLSLCGLLCSVSWAASSSSASNPGPGGQPPLSAELKAAFDACKPQGKPGDAAFEACMSSKGFKKPEGAPKPPER